jgi:hypothetical protein
LLALILDMIERQSRNVQWTIIDKGPFQLHPSLNNFILPAEVWLSMEVNEKESYIKRVMSSSVTDTVWEDYQETACFPNKLIPEGIPTEPFPDDISTEPIPDYFPTEFDKYIFYLLLMFWQMLHYPIQSKILQGHVCQICL